MKNSETIKNILYEILGMDPHSVGEKAIDHAIDMLMKNAGFDDKNLYLAHLSRDAEEQAKFIEEVTVPETWFFRDRKPFDNLKKYFLKSRSDNPGHIFRILSAPCCTGEEAYSAAIMAMESGILPEYFHVTGIDISHRAIDFAEKGEYTQKSFRDSFPCNPDKYFQYSGDNLIVKSNVKNTCNFVCGNILSEQSIVNAKYDVILCRNLLIYLNQRAKTKLTQLMKKILAPDGILVTGHSEISYFTRNGFSSIKELSSYACRLSDTVDNHNIAKRVKEKIKPPVRIIDNLKSLSRLTSKLPGRKKQEQTQKPEIVAPSMAKNNMPVLMQLANSGQYDKAEALCQKMLSDDTTNPQLYYIKGLIKESRGANTDAMECYNKVLYLDPGHYETLVHLALIYKSQGNIEKYQLFQARMQKHEE